MKVMAEHRQDSERLEADQHLEIPRPNEQLLRYMGLRESLKDRGNLAVHLVHQDVLFVGTDFP